MKILLGADQYPEYINGAANFTARLAAGLASAGHRVDLLWPSVDGQEHETIEQDVRIHRLPSVALPGRPRMQACVPGLVDRQVAAILDATQPDVVHVQSHLALGRSLVRAATAAGTPVVATNHFMPENLIPHVPVARLFPETVARWAWRDLERVFADADLVTAPTRRAVELLAQETGLTPAEVVSCGLDLLPYQRLTRPATATRPTVLFVGRLEPEKHVDELIQAFALLPASFGTRLDIVGMGSLRSRLEAEVRALGIEAAVTFTGAISEDELLQAYARADLFVMPGTAELQSLATLEAMAAGLPVVAANAMALPHLVHDQINGYLYQPGDQVGLADRMFQILSDPKISAALSVGSRQISAEHSLEATLDTFTGLYLRLITARQPRVPVETQLAWAS